MTTGENTGDFQLADGVFLTLADIREFQLAKAAIATGISFLLKYSGIRMEDLTRVYVTGGLGNHLNVDKIKRLGLLSQVPSDRFQVLPNVALWGCKLSLTGQDTAAGKIFCSAWSIVRLKQQRNFRTSIVSICFFLMNNFKDNRI